MVKAQALLPADKKNDRPLFMVLVILAFLATMTLLAVKNGYETAAGWRTQLGASATVQIKPGINSDDAALAAQARQILLTQDEIAGADILSQDRSKALLKPWLGDTELPDDLPLPILIDVTLKPGQTLNVNTLSAVLNKAGINADIDNHMQWSQDIKRSSRALQALSLLALFLIIIAVISAIIFATHAGITQRRKVMDVLHQIGATPAYTARLFSHRFAKNGFKAGAVGAFGAVALLFLISLAVSQKTYFLPGFKLGLDDLYLAAIVPVFLAIISGVSAWRTVRKTLSAEIYP